MGLGNLNTILVTGTYVVLPNGSPATGRVVFTPTAVLQDPAANQIVLPAAFDVPLDANGHFAVLLPATDDPDTLPIFTYSVTEVVTGGRTYSIEVPYNSPGGTLDLADVAPVAPVTGSSDFVLVSDYNNYVGTVANAYTVINWNGTSWPQRPSVPEVIWSGGSSSTPPPGVEGDIWVY